MARQRNLLVNFERMRREMDEMLGGTWPPERLPARGAASFAPRVDVYLCESSEGQEGERAPKVIAVADLAGVAPEAVNLEVAGRVLVISGHRPVRETEGRAYQQVEIPTGPFRRSLELGVEIDADRARATFEDGLLRIELPVRLPGASSRRVPIERPGES